MAQVTEEAVSDVAIAHTKFAEGLHIILDDRIAILDKQVESSSAAIATRVEKMVLEIETASLAFRNGAQNEQKALEDVAASARKSLSQFETITIDTDSLKSVEDALVVFTTSITKNLSSSALASSNHNEAITMSSESMSEVAKSAQSGIQKQLNIMEKEYHYFSLMLKICHLKIHLKML